MKLSPIQEMWLDQIDFLHEDWVPKNTARVLMRHELIEDITPHYQEPFYQVTKKGSEIAEKIRERWEEE